MYSSSVSILTATVFGWAAFIGFALNPASDLAKPSPIILFVGVVIIAIAAYNLSRVLHFAVLIWQLERDFGFLRYIARLQTLPGMRRLVSRRDAQDLTIAETVTAVILALYFVVPFEYLIILVLE